MCWLVFFELYSKVAKIATAETFGFDNVKIERSIFQNNHLFQYTKQKKAMRSFKAKWIYSEV